MCCDCLKLKVYDKIQDRVVSTRNSVYESWVPLPALAVRIISLRNAAHGANFLPCGEGSTRLPAF